MIRSILRRTAGVALVSVFSMAAPAQKPALFQFQAQPGPHPVGLKVVEQYDYSRTYRSAVDELGKPYTGERARPIQTLIWYPSAKVETKPMTAGGYVDLLATETAFDKPNPELAKETRANLAPSLASQLWAHRDAPLEAGRFPVVIYAPSFSAPSWENADLCEFLASYGYVVIAGPNLGARTREMTPDVDGINAQARDIGFLIGYALSLPDTDMSELAVAGYSWGGISNLFAAARDSRIKALVAWDGSLRYFPGLVKSAGDIHPEQMTIPLIDLIQGEFTIEDQEREIKDLDKPNVLNAWTHGDLTTVHLLGMAHEEFSTIDQRDESFWRSFPSMQKADYTREEGAVGYQWAAQYTLEFLNTYLKHDATAMAFLKKTPAENGAPRHFLTASFRPAKGLPQTLETFRAALGRQGFDHAGEIYAAMRKENGEFKADEFNLNSWARLLVEGSHFRESIELEKFTLQLYPESSDSYDILGEAYRKSGEKRLAVESYQKSLGKNPDDQEAKDRLQELQGNGAAKDK